MKYNEVVNKENNYKVFLCRLTSGSNVELQVHGTCEFDNKEVFVFYNFEDDEDLKEYLEEDVEEVLEQIEHDWYENQIDRRVYQKLTHYKVGIHD